MGVSSCKKTDDQVDRAIKWATQCGGIVTMCWHWYAPNDMNDYSKGSSFYYKTTGYDHKTCFDLCKGVTEGTAEYEFIIRACCDCTHGTGRAAEPDVFRRICIMAAGGCDNCSLRRDVFCRRIDRFGM